jgi:hypothetical protein
MRQGGPVIDAPGPSPEPLAVNEVGFEHYPRATSEAITAISGLRRIFTLEGRLERAREKEAKIINRNEIITWVANRISNPRTQTNPIDPARIGWVGGPMYGAGEKIGWVGTHTRESRSAPRLEEHSNLGKQLIDSKNLGTNPPVPNYNRPIMSAEESGSRRLEKHWQKRNAARGQAIWLSNSHGRSLSNGHHSLSRAERSNMAGTSRKAQKEDRKADRHNAKFQRIAQNEDIRGRFAQFRGRRLNSKVERLEDRLRDRAERREANFRGVV